MAIRLTEEFSVTTGQEWLGMLFVTDAELLFGRTTPMALEVLGFGYDEDESVSHVITDLSVQEAIIQLSRVFNAYARKCESNAPSFVRVCFFPNDGRTDYDRNDDRIIAREYGQLDRGQMLRINVYCGIPKDTAEDFLGRLLYSVEGGDPIVIVRPDDSTSGYSARGFVAAEAYEPYDG